MKRSTHPSQRFQAPRNIVQGVPLKELLGLDLIQLIAESFKNAFTLPKPHKDIHAKTTRAKFDTRRFIERATNGLEELTLVARGRHIGLAIIEQLPTPFAAACPLLISSFGPELAKTEGNGLAPFFYLPHTHVITEMGNDDFENGMLANYELTKRFTAEGSVRPFLAKYRDQALDRLTEWTADPNPHIRRLVSEGTRPRLPWAMRLKEFQQNPQLSLPLLERLKDDSEQYVRRSVANHVGDILKDHPGTAMELCERWLSEVSRKSITTQAANARKWIIRHAVRLPAKKGDPLAESLRLRSKSR